MNDSRGSTSGSGAVAVTAAASLHSHTFGNVLLSFVLTPLGCAQNSRILGFRGHGFCYSACFPDRPSSLEVLGFSILSPQTWSPSSFPASGLPAGKTPDFWKAWSMLVLSHCKKKKPRAGAEDPFWGGGSLKTLPGLAAPLCPF